MHSIYCNFSTYLCYLSVKTFFIPDFWPYNPTKRQIFLLWSFWIRSVSSSVSHPIYMKYHYLPVLLETQSPHYSAFLTIKSVTKANFPRFELLNQVYLLSSESSNPPEAISLLTCAFGDSYPLLFHFVDHEISQKGEFPSFWASEIKSTQPKILESQSHQLRPQLLS